jgi:excisionase family DNA binding protein
MKTNTIQFHNTTPEEFSKEIKSVIDKSLEVFFSKNSTNNQEKLLTREETAKLLSISLVTLWKWTKDNTISAFRIGNQIRYKQSDVYKALQKANGNVHTIKISQ